MAHEILDDNTSKPLVSEITKRLAWYIKHSAMILALYVVVLILVLFILPNLPKAIEDVASMGALGGMIFGMYGITLYTYVKGFEWNLLGGFLGGTISFFSCFIYCMINRDSLELYYHQHFAGWFPLAASMEKDTLDLMVVGIAYSILVIPCTEIMALMGWIGKTGWNWYYNKKK